MNHSLFSVYGIEVEYMIIDKDSFDVLPITDKLIYQVANEYLNEIEQGEIAWSNELALHVIELKTNGPAKTLKGLPELFLKNLTNIQKILDEMNAKLLPGAMHPWMDPYKETKLWLHDSKEIYDTYDRIFNCQGHGWSNLQSMHINLPFADDREFKLLHSAIRTILPILPAMSASSPIVDGEITGLMDTRLEVYRRNAERIPSITGLIVPEAVSSEQEYQDVILKPMYKDIAKYDPEKILQEEWLNSRGAIARFDRNAIEIRVLDTQETPAVDLALATVTTKVIKKLTEGKWSSNHEQNKLETAQLADILMATIKDAEYAVISDKAFLNLFRFPEKKCNAKELWYYLFENIMFDDESYESSQDIISSILKQGPLARRMLNSVGKNVKQTHLKEMCQALSSSLIKGEMYHGF